ICGGFPGLPCSPYSHWSLYRGTSSYLVSDTLRAHGLAEARELTILALSLSDLTGSAFKNPLSLFDHEDSKLQQLDVSGHDLLEPEQLLEPMTDTSSESQVDASADDPQNDSYSLGLDIGLLDRLSGDVVCKSPLRS